MTVETLHIKTKVLPGNRIEVTAPELIEGEGVEALLTLPRAAAPARRSARGIIGFVIVAAIA
jgi:hypothetical protein